MDSGGLWKMFAHRRWQHTLCQMRALQRGAQQIIVTLDRLSKPGLPEDRLCKSHMRRRSSKVGDRLAGGLGVDTRSNWAETATLAARIQLPSCAKVTQHLFGRLLQKFGEKWSAIWSLVFLTVLRKVAIKIQTHNTNSTLDPKISHRQSKKKLQKIYGVCLWCHIVKRSLVPFHAPSPRVPKSLPLAWLPPWCTSETWDDCENWRKLNRPATFHHSVPCSKTEYFLLHHSSWLSCRNMSESKHFETTQTISFESSVKKNPRGLRRRQMSRATETFQASAVSQKQCLPVSAECNTKYVKPKWI